MNKCILQSHFLWVKWCCSPLEKYQYMSWDIYVVLLKRQVSWFTLMNLYCVLFVFLNKRLKHFCPRMRMLCHLQCLLQRIPGGRFVIDRVVGAVVSKKWNDYAWCCFKFMASESVASSEAIVNPSQSLLCQQGSQLSTWRSALNQWPYGLTSMLVHGVTVSVQFKLRERKLHFGELTWVADVVYAWKYLRYWSQLFLR